MLLFLCNSHQETNKREAIVDEKFYYDDWLTMLDSDEAQDVTIDFMNDLMERVDAHITELEIIPYTVDKVKRELVEMINVFFIDGESTLFKNEILLNAQDEEPRDCEIDSWANGCLLTQDSCSLRKDTNFGSQILRKSIQSISKQYLTNMKNLK